jgi:hypothetical protein
MQGYASIHASSKKSSQLRCIIASISASPYPLWRKRTGFLQARDRVQVLGRLFGPLVHKYSVGYEIFAPEGLPTLHRSLKASI